MKITIDTKEDSPEEIKRIVGFLSSLVGEREIMSNRNIFDDSKPSESGSAFVNMFGSDDNKPVEDKPKKEKLQLIEYV